MARPKISLAILVLAACASLTAAQSAAPVSELSVWRPAKGVLSAIRTKCGAGNPADIQPCFLTAMKNQGASNSAIAFAQSMANTGQLYLNFFRKTAGKVSVGYITYVFRANSMKGIVLLNGDPSPINVDDPQYLTMVMLAQNPVFQQLVAQHPNLMSFPADRTNNLYPEMRARDAGGQQALVRYLLKDCHACATVGTARASFTFDASGKFTGAKLLSVIPGGPPTTENPVESNPAGEGITHNRAPHSPQAAANAAHFATASYAAPSRQQAPAAQAQSANEAAAHGAAAQIPDTSAHPATEVLPPQEIRSKVGDRFTITLEGNRSTGYIWKLSSKPDPKLLKKITDTIEPKNRAMPGAGELSHFYFHCYSKGSTTLTFEYSRPWEKNTPPAKSATYSITIN